jgi:general secretion pathway protein E/type IV pilus assembly protein PilB
MEIGDRIPTELIQKFTASQAWDYMIVPCTQDGVHLCCYGEEGRKYDDIITEIDVLLGILIVITPISETDLHKLLRQYYRNDQKQGHGKQSIDEIVSGQEFLFSLIEQAFDSYASDIHIECYEERCRIRFRIDGKLIERYVIGKSNYASLVNQIKIIANLDIAEKRLPQDGRILYNNNNKKFDVRVSTLPSIYGEKIVMRLLTRHIELLELSNLGFTEKQLTDYCYAVEKPHGMVLICGPTGSGKSTTLYATLRRLTKETNNILTIEDPVEYTLEGANQVQLKEEIGLTFSGALRTFLRQDPDIIMLGEIRDAETAQMAIRSSLTGHLLFSTIHTNNAWGSIARLADMDVHPYLTASTLIMCVAQRLVRLLCPHCKESQPVTEEIAALMERDDIDTVYRAGGCSHCYYTGYSGRRAIYEVIPIDAELMDCIRRSETDIEPLLKSREIVSLREAGVDMLIKGDTSLEELIPILKS